MTLTDAPGDYFASAPVDIGAIEILPADGPPIELTADAGVHDLLELQDGVGRDLATPGIVPGWS